MCSSMSNLRPCRIRKKCNKKKHEGKQDTQKVQGAFGGKPFPLDLRAYAGVLVHVEFEKNGKKKSRGKKTHRKSESAFGVKPVPLSLCAVADELVHVEFEKNGTKKKRGEKRTH